VLSSPKLTAATVGRNLSVVHRISNEMFPGLGHLTENRSVIQPLYISLYEVSNNIVVNITNFVWDAFSLVVKTELSHNPQTHILY
jgi:hypothetical protein